MCSCRKMSQMAESSLILPGYHRILLMIYSCIVCQAVYAEWDYWGHGNYNPLYSVVGMILCIISKLGFGTNVMKASCVVCYIIIYTSDWRVSASSMSLISYGYLTRYVTLRVAHAPGMPGKFSPPPTSMETACQPSRHASRHVRDARAVMHVGIVNPRWWWKRSRHSRRMRNPQFYVSGKRPMLWFGLVTSSSL